MKGKILDIVGLVYIVYCLVWGGYVIISSDPDAPITLQQVFGLIAWFMGIVGLAYLIERFARRRGR